MIANRDGYNFFAQSASKLPNWNTIERNTLINLCVEHENKEDFDQYLSALLCQYWYLIDIYYKKDISQNVEDYTAWYIEGVMKALKYRGWLDPKQVVSKDPNGPRKVVERCVHTVIGNNLAYCRRDRRIANSMCVSIDNTISDEGDTFIELDLVHEDLEAGTICNDIIQAYIDNNKYIDAVILDSICYGGEISNGKFSLRGLTKDLSSLNKSYADYFAEKYNSVNYPELTETCKKLINMSKKENKTNFKLKKQINKVLSELKNNKDVMSVLCC